MNKLWPKLYPLLFAALLLVFGYTWNINRQQTQDIRLRDAQLMETLSTSPNINTLLKNDSIKAFILSQVGDSFFVDTVFVQTTIYDTVYEPQYVTKWYPKTEYDTVYLDTFVQYVEIMVPTEASGNLFSGTNEDVQRLTDSVLKLNDALVFTRGYLDSLAYQLAVSRDTVAQLKTSLYAEIQSNKKLLAQRDSMERAFLIANAEMSQKLKKKSNPLGLGIGFGPSASVQLDGTYGLGASLVIGMVYKGSKISK